MTGIEELPLLGALATGGGVSAGTVGAAGSLAAGGAAAYTAAQAGKGPKLAPPVDMPDPNDPAALEARRRKMADLEASKGRESTILDNSAPTYVNSQLGL